jgi:ribosomal protein S3AE
MRKKKNVKTQPIDFNNLTPAQEKSVNRILNVGATASRKEDQKTRAIQKAMADELADAVNEASDSEVAAVFEMLLAICSIANGKKIIQHPRCPDDLVAAFLEETQKPARKPKAEETSSPNA